MDPVSYFESSFSTGLFYRRQKKRELKAIVELTQDKDFLIEESKIAESKKVLDIGFHSSLELNLLRSIHPNANIVGIDVTPKKNKRIAREFKDVSTTSIMTGDINRLDFEKNYFSAIYCLRTINVVENIDTFLEQCFSILDKKSFLILSLDHTETLTPKYLQDYNQNGIKTTVYRPSNIVKALKTKGFYSTASSKLKELGLEIVIAYKKK